MIIRRRIRGFSLIEILVVVVIVAIVTSIALLSIGLLGTDRQLETEARRLASLVEVAQDEAIMQGRDFGMEFMIDAYRFVEYDPYSSQWIELPDDELLRMRRLPEDVEFELFLEDKQVLLEYEPADIEAPEEDAMVRTGRSDYVPHVLIYSSGDVTPFELAVTRPLTDRSVRVQGDFTGSVEIASSEE